MKKKEINYQLMWAKAVDDQDEAVRKLPRELESYDSRMARMAFGIYKLQCFCERLSQKYESPWLQLKDVEAGRLYLLNKHHWAPELVRSLKLIDLLQLLHEELANMKLTKEEWEPVHSWSMNMYCYPDLAESAPAL